MTPGREAVVLPVLFLTVVLAAALRPGADLTIVPPPPGALVVATAMLALLVRSGVVAPGRLLHPERGLLANLNGCMVLFTVFAASAQVIAALVPEASAAAAMTWVVIVALLLQAFALGPDRPRLLRGLMVTFGVVFTMKFVVLAASSGPSGSAVGRALRLLFEGLTLGTMTQRPLHAAEGYLAFAAVALYLVGLGLLPPASWHIERISGYASPQINRHPDVPRLEADDQQR